MASYPRPTSAQERRLKFSLRDKKRGKRVNPPGQHGDKRHRVSPFLAALQEKQKIRFLYGLRERQLLNLFIKLSQKKESNKILVVCESFLVNVLFASKWFKSRLHARQQIAHGHIKVITSSTAPEEKPAKVERVKSASYHLKPGQVISFWEKEIAENGLIKPNLEREEKVPGYLGIDKQKLTITYLREPTPEEVERKINLGSVTEWYSRKRTK
ncbi:MAG: 30S ribosomal protein S4 [Candidatus Moeniiplasma glomeromycotorum]|nr:30S ribosomal protein S4 [Candidatus Moeniiplasma glomeromycotorum]MCE8168052.1 30S ribosomal protein S4 [Candidatus Moeniiplasma glomeromycotorum]MCE8169569.1 30S ribosomal protein S4 [Candidatus Moeniiplasma glomeromycotorum]